jgi:hypothetical protein
VFRNCGPQQNAVKGFHCEFSCQLPKEELRLISENMDLKRIFGPKKEDITGY